jgi:hypothetical protein
VADKARAGDMLYLRLAQIFFMHIFLMIGVGIASGVVFASFFEWTLHRFLMHRPLFGLRYAFEAHAVIHHTIFKADHTYHLQHEKDKKTIPMAWWNGPLLILFTQIPFILIAYLTTEWWLVAGSLPACILYYVTYEYMHWCMHLPKKRKIERSGIFFRLNGHHLLHHRYMQNNYNVVLPLADLCLGTLLLRSKVSFAQAKGPAVPNVQPRRDRVFISQP